jgi:hypothetical protein
MDEYRPDLPIVLRLVLRKEERRRNYPLSCPPVTMEDALESGSNRSDGRPERTSERVDDELSSPFLIDSRPTLGPASTLLL